MDRDYYARALIAMVTKLASARGTAACGPITAQTDLVPDHMMPEDHRAVWSAVRTLATNGTPPTIPALRRVVTGRPGDYWVGLTTEERGIDDVRERLVSEFQWDRIIDVADTVRSMRATGQPIAGAIDLLAHTGDEAVAGVKDATPLKSIDYMRRVRDIRTGKLVLLPTGSAQLDATLGGGLEPGGRTAVTTIKAYSSMGKSAFGTQVCNATLDANHWVTVFTGEASSEEYVTDFARLRLNIPKSRAGTKMNAADETLIGAELAKLEGRLWFYDDDFNADLIRGVMARRAHDLRTGIADGRIDPRTRHLVMIDNIDHSITLGGDQQWAALDASVQALVSSARRYDTEVLILAQANPESYVAGRAPYLHEYSRAKFIATHVGNDISLYRPINDSDRANPDRNTPIVAVRKARYGYTNEFTARCDDAVGKWDLR